MFVNSHILAAAIALTAVPAILIAQETRYLPAKEGAHYMFNYYLPPAPSSTPWWPAWAPDGKALAVAMQGSIWRVDPKTGAASELVSGKKYLSSPAWSPDGKWLAYTADDDGKDIQLEILNVSTGESHPLTTDHHIYTDPTFSPDGTRLCYVSTLPTGIFNVYVHPIRDGRWDHDAARAVAKVIGERRTVELALTGRVFSTPDALAWGLVHAVAPAFELDDRAFEIALSLAKANPEAIRAGLSQKF